MGDDYDNNSSPPVPTFSDGCYANRGAKLNADASRLSATKHAIAVASRASAMAATSMQQLQYNTRHPVISHQSVQPKNIVNKQAIQVAEKRAKDIMQQIILSEQVANITNSSQNIFNYDEDNSVPIYTAPQPLEIKETTVVNHLDTYRDIVIAASNRKKLLLESYKYSAPKTFNNRKVLLVQSTSPETGQVDPSLLLTLSTNLSRILNTSSDKNELLNELDRHNLRVRISLEEPIHKSAVEKARIIKNTYFTSDT